MKRALLCVFCPMMVLAADVSGSWHFMLERFGEQFADARVKLNTNGSKVTGTLNELKLEGTVQDDTLKITAMRPNGQSWGTLEGRVDGDRIAGTVKRGDDQFDFSATRLRPAEAGSPQTHTFEPVKFHACSQARLNRRCASGPATQSAPGRWMREGVTRKGWSVPWGQPGDRALLCGRRAAGRYDRREV